MQVVLEELGKDQILEALVLLQVLPRLDQVLTLMLNLLPRLDQVLTLMLNQQEDGRPLNLLKRHLLKRRRHLLQ